MSKNPTLSIVIVNYNGQRWLTNCFNSIVEQKIPNLEIIFVDNNSTDDSIKIVKKIFPKVIVIKNKSNLGFGKANNQGSHKASGKFLLFLNTDTRLRPKSLKNMLEKMVAKNIDLAGPKILDYKLHDYYNNRKLTLDIVGSLSWGKKTVIIEGCCLMVRKDVFDSLVGFDESFFMYSEDLDLCWRAWLLGCKIALVNSAIVEHYGGGSSLPTMIGTQKYQAPVFRRYEAEKNTLKMMIKNASTLHLLFSLPILVTLIVGESFLYLITGQFKASQYLIKSLWWNLQNLRSTLLDRSRIQKNKVRGNIWPLLAKKITKFEVLKLIGIPQIKL